jgi:hypothetical protein
VCAARRGKRHSQRGQSLGLCPHCLQQMWKDQKTIITPTRDEQGNLHAVLGHESCPR